MPVYFNFEATDGYVTLHLTAAEIRNVATWQNMVLEYDFSFHEAHTAGNPLYVCKRSGHGQRSMPKIDTKGKVTAAMVNQEKLTKAQKEDAIAVVNANWALFARLGQEYYDPVDEAPVVIATSSPCINPKCNIPILLTQAANPQGFRVCPKCGKWNA